MRKSLLSLPKKDFVIWYYSGTGAGGQHRNRHMNCVKITHPESGVTAAIKSEQLANAIMALANNEGVMHMLDSQKLADYIMEEVDDEN